MIKLVVESYCHECEEFDPDIEHSEVTNNTYIKCSNRDRCKDIANMISKHMNDGTDPACYICDRKACGDKCSPECTHTNDPKHAKNFEYMFGLYWEVKKDD